VVTPVTTTGGASRTRGPPGSARRHRVVPRSRGLHDDTRSPIKHVIVIIGENRTFDHLFATYKPKGGQRVDNLLAKGIVRDDGSPGPNFSRFTQKTAALTAPSAWTLSPGSKAPYTTLPPPLSGGPQNAPFSTIAHAKNAENGLADDYYVFLTTGGTGFASKQVDTRIAGVDALPPE